MSTTLIRLTVLLKPEDANRLDAYCDASGRKKSTLVARLIRDHLDKESSAKTRDGRRRARTLEDPG